jgi:hypothetical protein
VAGGLVAGSGNLVGDALAISLASDARKAYIITEAEYKRIVAETVVMEVLDKFGGVIGKAISFGSDVKDVFGQ